MHIWLPAIRTGTGTDRYTQKLSDSLSRYGVGTTLQWFSLREEVLPMRLQWVRPPRFATHVHVNAWLPAALDAAGLPLILTAHTASELSAFDGHKRLGQRVYHRHVIRPRVAANLRRAAVACGVSPAVCSHYARSYGAHLHCVPNWLGPDDVIDTAPPSSGPATVLFIGRPGWHKGSDLLPALASQLPSGARLVCTLSLAEWMGSPPANVELCGRVDRPSLNALLRRADLVVVPSRHEGFSLAALEAMAAGVPVIGFAGSGIDGLVLDQQTGLLVAMEDVTLLAKAIARLLSDTAMRHVLGEQAQEWARSAFSEVAVLSQLIDLYASAGKPSRSDDPA